MTPAHFREHLDVLRRSRRVVPLGVMLASLRAGESLEGTVAVTFDDGYADVGREAAPALEEYEIPATAFVITSAVGSEREFWWDELEQLVLHARDLPEILELEIGGAIARWDFGAARPLDLHGALARLSLGLSTRRPFDLPRYRGWRVWIGEPPTSRHALYRDFWQRCQTLSIDERDHVLRQLRAAVGDGRGGARDSHRAMTVEELRSLAASGLCDIGAHSITHPKLASLSGAAQLEEIAGSKRWLETILDRPVTTFAYPFGGARDYTRETVELVRQAGYRGACANVPGAIIPDQDAYQLPRLFVHDWDGDEFARRLTEEHA